MTSDLMLKIGKLLTQAENAGTPEEAEAFMAKAQMLGTSYSIDLAKARAAVAKGMKREEPVVRRMDVAEYRSKTKKHMVSLYNTIANANDVRITITSDSTTVYPHGFASDIDVVDALFVSLSMQMVEQANAWLATGEYKRETELKWDNKTGEWVNKPIDGRVARASFYRSFIETVGDRLRRAKEAAEAEVMSVESDGGTGTELVLVEKRKEVGEFYAAKTKGLRGWSGSASGGYSSSGSSAGRSAGKSATLSSGKAVGGARKQIGA